MRVRVITGKPWRPSRYQRFKTWLRCFVNGHDWDTYRRTERDGLCGGYVTTYEHECRNCQKLLQDRTVQRPGRWAK